MGSGRLRAVATSSQAWAIIQRGFAPRLTLLTSGRKDERRKAVAQLEGESARRGNSANYLSARVDLEIEHLDNYATQLYEACSEIADVEGLARNRAFNNAVFEHCITQAFAGRRSGLEGELLLRDQRINRAGCSASAIAAFSQRVNQLHSEWGAKLEIESLNFEAKERVERERAALLPSPQVPTASFSEGQTQALQKQKLGRKEQRSRDFTTLAAGLWRQRKGPTRRVSHVDLTEIGVELDSHEFGPPSKYLEGKAAKELKARNSRNANSKNAGAIQTWSVLIARADKEDLRAMRKMLARCASKQA